MLHSGKLLWFENIGIVSSLILLDFRGYYNGDLNKIIRDVSKSQSIVYSLDVDYKEIKSADEACDILEKSKKGYKDPAVVTYTG